MMPRQNRVTPFGEIVAVPNRNMLFMGNRGRLHNDQQQIVRQFFSYKTWVACLTQFKGRKRELMQPGKYTELFFLDEPTALAAGHRPCGRCRHTRFQQFTTAWLIGNPQAGLGAKPPIASIDRILHKERLTEDGEQRTFQAKLGELPDGTFVRLPGSDNALLVWSSRLHRWTPGGYDRAHPADPAQIVDVLTPRSIVSALRAGYQPEPHPTLTVNRSCGSGD